MGLFNKIENNFDDYNDIPDYLGYLPDCPYCGETMKYSYCRSEFKCPNCNSIIDEDDLDLDDSDDDKPWVCEQCGGPYPSCTTSCKMFDE